MKLKYEKAVRIATDLLGYCRYLGASEMHLDIALPAGSAHINVSAKVPSISNTEYERLITDLQLPRQYEVEQNYWNISGEEDTDPDLSMVGMMVDEANITFEDNILKITVIRKDI